LIFDFDIFFSLVRYLLIHDLVITSPDFLFTSAVKIIVYVSVYTRPTPLTSWCIADYTSVIFSAYICSARPV